MTAFSAHPAWDFVSRLYAAQGVAPACLDLQERHGIDVTFMLFCLWRGSVSAKPLGAHMPALAATAREWHEAVVLPLRAARRRLKAEAIASPRPEARALYKTVMAAEIDCESWGQLFLKFIVSHPAVTAAIPATSKPKNMADNLGAAFGRMPDTRERARIAAALA